MTRRVALLLLLLGCGLVTKAADSLLVDDLGRRVTTRQLTGRWLLVTFGYAHCPDVCPTTLHRISATLPRLPNAGSDLDVYFVSVDPERDSPQALHRFLSGISPKLHGLTGTAEALEDARRTFGVPARQAGGGFDHGVFIYLVAPDGRVVDTFHPNATPSQLAQRITARLRAPVSTR